MTPISHSAAQASAARVLQAASTPLAVPEGAAIPAQVQPPLDAYLPPEVTTDLSGLGEGRFVGVSALTAGAAALFEPVSALAQTPQTSDLVATLSHLPPTWQIVAGGLLYGEPAIRMVSRIFRGIGERLHRALFRKTEKTSSGTDPSTVDKINEWTGAWYNLTSPVTDNFLVRLGLGITSLHGVTTGQPLSDYGIIAGALAVSLWSGFDKGGRVQAPLIRLIQKKGEITIEAWHREEDRALGLLAPPVPDHLPESDRIKSNPPPYATDITPKKSTWYNVKGLVDTLYFIGMTRRLFGQIGSRWEGFKGWAGTLFLKKHAPANPKFLRASHILTRLWAMRYLNSNKITVTYTNREALDIIPKDAPVLTAMINHDSLFLNFASLFYLRPGLRMLADEANFWKNPVLRVFGFSWMMDVIGLLFSTRGHGAKAGNEIEKKAKALLKNAKHGIELAIFPQAGRTPRMYDDQGHMIPPSVRSNVVGVATLREDGRKIKKVLRAELYLKDGFARIAIAAANLSGKSVFLPLILSDDGSNSHGMYYASPKKEKKPPFIGPNLSGQTAQIKCQHVFEVKPITNHANKDAAKKAATRLYNEVVAEAITGLEDNKHLRTIVKGWSERKNLSHLALRHGILASKDERWYTLVARIASVHPHYFKPGDALSQREQFIDRLFDLMSREDPSNDDLKLLLTEASQTVIDTEYMTFKVN